jgi:hypothetical protein
MLVILLSPIPELQHAPLPPKCCEPKNVPPFFALSMFHFKLTFESIKELGSVSLNLTIIPINVVVVLTTSNQIQEQQVFREHEPMKVKMTID